MIDGMDFGSDMMDAAIWSPGCIIPIILLIIGIIIYCVASDNCGERCGALGLEMTGAYDHCLCVNEDGTLTDPNKE